MNYLEENDNEEGMVRPESLQNPRFDNPRNEQYKLDNIDMVSSKMTNKTKEDDERVLYLDKSPNSFQNQARTNKEVLISTQKKELTHFNFLQRVIENTQPHDWKILLKPRKKLLGHVRRPIHFCWGGNNRLVEIVSCDEIGQVIHWNSKKGKQLTFFDLQIPLLWVDVDPDDGRFAIAGAQNGRIYVMQLNPDSKKPKVMENMNELYVIDAYDTAVTVTTFLSSNFIMSGSADGTVSIWDLKEEKHFIAKYNYHEGGITTAAASPEDPNLILTGATDRSCKIWDIRVKNPVQHEYFSHLGAVHDIEFMPGLITSFASCGDDGSIRLYDIRMNKEIACLIDSNYNDPINSISFSPSGRVILAATDNRTVKLWDTLLDNDPFQYLDYGFIVGLQWAKLSKDGFALAVLDKEGILGTAF